MEERKNKSNSVWTNQVVSFPPISDNRLLSYQGSLVTSGFDSNESCELIASKTEEMTLGAI